MADQMKQRVVVLGGGYAGMMSIGRMLRAKTGAEITLVAARPEFAQRIRFHELLAGRPLKTYRYAPLLARRGVRFQQGWVERIDLAENRVELRDAAGHRGSLTFDYLLLALGSSTRAQLPGVAEHALRLDDPAAIRAAAAQLPHLATRGGRILIVGAGLTGLETAVELAQRYPGLKLQLVGTGEWAGAFSAVGAQHLRRVLAAQGVELLEGTGVTALAPGAAHVAGGGKLSFDLCVWCAGFEPSPLGREAGLASAPDGRAVVDAELRSVSHPQVFVAGDTALVQANGREVRMSCASAFAMGAHAGDNLARLLAGEAPQPFHFGFGLRCVSLGRKEALVQMTEMDDTPREKIVTGRGGALIKELICRMTLAMPQLEIKTGRSLYRWPNQEGPAAGHAAAVPPLKEKEGLSR